MESQCRGSISDSFAVAGKPAVPRHLSLRAFDVDADKADGLLRGAASGARDTGDGDSHIGAQTGSRPACHRRSGFFRHGTVSAQGLA